jgi:hypothetical protein
MRTWFVSAIFLLATPAENPLELPGAVATLLKSGSWAATPAGFRVIALSQIADGCANQARARTGRTEQARACALRAEALARALGPAELSSANGLYLTHLNLILGAEDELGGCSNPALHARLSQRLASRSLADPTAHVASYAGLALRWPADQAATLASLARYDRAHHASLTPAPLARWEASLSRTMDPARALPWSEVTGKGAGARLPRGCAQSYISRYLAEVDPALSNRWWLQYREHFLVRPGHFVGFREWPRGVDLAADSDSGPIILGIGAAASAFGVAAARAQADTVLAAQLEASEDLVLSTGAGGAAASSTLAEAIRFEARWQPSLVETGVPPPPGQR